MSIDKIASSVASAGAYANTAKTADVKELAGDDTSFSSLLKNSASSAIQTLRNSEAVQARALSGDADITEVVSSVNNADLMLKTVASLREKMIGAYQDIMRMTV